MSLKEAVGRGRLPQSKDGKALHRRHQEGPTPGLCPTGSVGEKIKLGSSSLMLNVGFTPLQGDPVAIPRSFLLAPVFFRVKLSQHGAMFRSHSAPGPVIWDPRVRETFSHHSPVT